jgi:hypothetical protein
MRVPLGLSLLDQRRRLGAPGRDELREIDRIVALGSRACVAQFPPRTGLPVARPAEAAQPVDRRRAQRVCAQHWAAFARRYRGIPNAKLSFHLFNEPAGSRAGLFWRRETDA